MARRIPAKLSVVLAALTAGLCALAIAWPTAMVDAQRLRCTVYLTQARIPQRGTERALLTFARRHRARHIQETDEAELNDRNFSANAVFAFNRAPGDLEFHALFYDIHDGARSFRSEMSIFVSDRSQRTVLHRLRLPRPEFRPNRRMEMVVTVRHQEVGTLRFETRGEEVRHSGQVDFSDSQR